MNNENKQIDPMELHIGKIFNYNNKPCVIVGGFYYGTNGGISNFWHFRPILPNGTLGKTRADYANNDKFTECSDTYEIRYIKQ